jgi:ribose transport system ATP-binding protein
MGLMGSGRTRLANCLFGKERPSGGRIRVGGREARIRHPADAMRLGLALVPEDRDQNALFHSQDVVSNMTVASLPRFKEGPLLDTGYMGELTDEYVRGLGINPVGNSEQLRSYSGGNQQKVIVARWLMSLCRVFILDEPTRGVDAAARIDIYNAMNDLLMKGASILLISSEVEEILGMCDRILVLARGKIACDLPRSEVTKDLIFDYASG